MKDVVQPGWIWGSRCLGLYFLFVKPRCVSLMFSASFSSAPLIHEVEMLLVFTEKKADYLADYLLCFQQPLVCVWEQGDLKVPSVCVHINNTKYKHGQQWHQWSDSVSPSSLQGAWQSFRGSENHETGKKKKYKSKMQWSLQEQRVTVGDPSSLLSFTEHQKQLPGLLRASGREQHYLFPGICPLSAAFLIFLSEFSRLDQYFWLWQSDLCHSSAHRSKKGMETPEQEGGGVQHGVLLGVFGRWHAAGFVQVQTWQDSHHF